MFDAVDVQRCQARMSRFDYLVVALVDGSVVIGVTHRGVARVVFHTDPGSLLQVSDAPAERAARAFVASHGSRLLASRRSPAG